LLTARETPRDTQFKMMLIWRKFDGFFKSILIRIFQKVIIESLIIHIIVLIDDSNFARA
jgi:hypothetical protein